MKLATTLRLRSRRGGGVLAVVAASVAVVLTTAIGSSSAAPRAAMDTPCFGGPAIGAVCGTLTEANLHSLVNDLTLAQKVGLVHGQAETTDPQFGCGNTGLPTAFPVINPGATGAARVAGCVGQAGVNNGAKSLGIPPLRQTDGPAGVRLSHQETGLPAPVGLTATFDRSAANAYGEVIGREGRATNQDVLYAPMINLAAFVTAGRNFETLGEDPFLAGQLVADETLGVQGQGLIVTLKHMAENDFENSRTNTAVKLDERMLHELELQAFEQGIEKGHAGSIMCAYSRISQSDTGFDTYSCGNSLLLNAIARNTFGFTGWVLTDFGAIHRLSDILGGVDSAMPNGNNAGIRDEPDPGNLSDPPLNANVFNAGAGFPGGAPGSGKTLTQAVLNGTNAIPVNGNYPPIPATTGAEWLAALDQSVFHILTSMNRADLLEGTPYGSQSGGCTAAAASCTPVVPARPDLQTLMAPDFAIAKDVAEKSATLLKNDGGALPMSSSDFAGNGVLVLGPTATATYVGGGGSAHVTPFEPITNSLTALRAAAGSGTVNYVQGYDLDGQLVPSSAASVPAGASVLPSGLPAGDAAFAGQSGWLRQQISTTVPASGSEPAACTGTCAADQVDPTVDYTSNTTTLPAGTAWRWTTHFTVPPAPAGSSSWQLKVFVKNQGTSGAQLFVDGLATAQRRVNIGAYGVAAGGIGGSSIAAWDGLAQSAKSHDGLELQQAAFTATLAAGETHELDLRAYANSTDPLSVRFEWVPPDWQAQSIAAATAAASSANKVVIFAFDDGAEGADRGGNDQNAGLQLPGWEDALISAVAAANPNVIVVLNTGDAVYMPWLGSVKSVLEMWYPGVAGGVATADVLTGAVDPSGKLPLTFPDGSAPRPRFPTDDPGCNPAAIVIPNNSTGTGANDGNCPLYPGTFLSDPTQGPHTYRTVDMTPNGIFQGYRWYDLHNVAPLFPFGHGLSYTSFTYSGLSVAPTATGLDVTFTVQNTGSVAGAEVPQVYVGPPAAPPVPLAVKSLVGFERVPLAPGESKQVTIHVDKRGLSYWSTATHDWQLALGNRTVYVGSSSRDIRLQTDNATAPAITITADRAADHNGWYNHPVTFTATGSGAAGTSVTCDVPTTYSGPDTATGSLTLHCTDTAGTTSTASVAFKYDATPPVITAPASITTNAIAPGGVDVSFTASASDAMSGAPAPTCAPASGSTFAIGHSTVTCNVSDDAGNSATKSFDVFVKGATAQLADLSNLVDGLPIQRSLKRELGELLDNASRSVGRSSTACRSLDSFLLEAIDQATENRPGLTIAQAKRLLVANRIEAVLGCESPASPAPQAESDLLDVVATIRGFRLDDHLSDGLTGEVGDIAKLLVRSSPSKACRPLAALSRAIADATSSRNRHDRLTPAEAAALRAAIDHVSGELGC